MMNLLKLLWLSTLLTLFQTTRAEEAKANHKRIEKIQLGASYTSVIQALKDSGARNISDSVGIKYAMQTHENIKEMKVAWFELSDSTCVSLLFYRKENDRSLSLYNIFRGEQGMGYGDKLSWSKQNVQPVETIDLKKIKE